MPGTEPAQKLCVVCGEDVAGKPRVKDAQGRYLCKGACETAYAAKHKVAHAGSPGAPARAAAPAGGGSVMDQLIAASPMLSAVKCGSCGSPMPQGAVICTRCGFNAQSGKAVKTRVIVEKAKKADAGPGVAARLSQGTFGVLLSPLVSGLLMVLLFGAIGFSPALIPDMLWPAAILFGVCGLVCTVWAISEAFQEGEHTMAGLMVFQLSAFIPFSIIRFGSIIGFLAMLWYVFITCDNGRLKGLYLATLVGNVALVAAYFSALAQSQS